MREKSPTDIFLSLIPRSGCCCRKQHMRCYLISVPCLWRLSQNLKPTKEKKILMTGRTGCTRLTSTLENIFLSFLCSVSFSSCNLLITSRLSLPFIRTKRRRGREFSLSSRYAMTCAKPGSWKNDSQTVFTHSLQWKQPLDVHFCNDVLFVEFIDITHCHIKSWRGQQQVNPTFFRMNQSLYLLCIRPQSTLTQRIKPPFSKRRNSHTLVFESLNSFSVHPPNPWQQNPANEADRRARNCC